MQTDYDAVPSDVSERDDRVRKLLEELSTYPHGKDGTHHYHSLTEKDYVEVVEVMKLFGDTPESD